MNPEMGGAEVFTREVAKRLVKSGHEVTLFTSKFDGCKGEEVDDGVRIIRAGKIFNLSVYWKAKKYYMNRFSKEDYDVIIDGINTRPFLTPNFVNNREKIVALIYQLAREYWFYETPFPISYIGCYFLENKWLRNYMNLPTVTISESTKRDLLDIGFKKVFIVPVGLNFTPLSKIPEKEKYPVIAYAGRLKRAKRPDHAIKAFKIIKEKIPEAELWIIGEGPYRGDLERMAGDGVKFFGGLSNEERRKLLARAWILVNPSVREGFGLNVLEANALGTPCIAYDVAGLRDSIIDGKTGLLVKENGNVEKLAEAIFKMYQRPEFKRLGRKSRALIEKKFDRCKIAEKFLSMIKQIV